MVQFNNFNSQDKILNYTDKLDYFYNSHKTLIVTELDLTNKCNNKCIKCVGNNKDNDELSWLEIEDIINGLRELDNKGVILSGGGEPLLYPRFSDAVRLIKKSNMHIGVNSNGLALTQDKAEVIAQNCDYFRISLDAGCGDTYKRTHGMNKNYFNKVIDNIKMMVKIKNQQKSLLSLGTGFLTSKDTIHDIENYIILSKECGVDFVQLRPFQEDMTDITNIYKLMKCKYDSNNFKVLASIQKYDKFNLGKVKMYDKCRGMFFSTVITANARVYACLHHRQNENYIIGDMRKGKTLYEIWTSYKKWLIYEKLDVSQCPSFCRNDKINDTLFMLCNKAIHKEFL